MIAISGVYLNVNMYNFINVIIKEYFINFMILKDFIFMVLNIQNICNLTSLIFLCCQVLVLSSVKQRKITIINWINKLFINFIKNGRKIWSKQRSERTEDRSNFREELIRLGVPHGPLRLQAGLGRLESGRCSDGRREQVGVHHGSSSGREWSNKF